MLGMYLRDHSKGVKMIQLEHDSKFIVDVKQAIKDGISKEEVLDAVEKFLSLKYHNSYDHWHPQQYHYLSKTMYGDYLTGVMNCDRPGFRDKVLIDWYDIQVLKNQDNNVKSIFNESLLFEKELL